MFTPNQLRFGFEYETLVEVHPTYIGTFRNVLALVKHECELHGSQLNPNTMQRMALAALFNLMGGDMFRIALKYHGDVYDTIHLVHVLLNHGDRIAAADPGRSWVVTHDGSVEGNIDLYDTFENHRTVDRSGGYLLQNMEIVSPILSWKMVHRERFVSTFRTMTLNGGLKYWNNPTTSNHVHISCLDEFKKPGNIVKLAMAWWYFEMFFMSLVGEWRHVNKYCKTKHASMVERFGSDNARTLFHDITLSNHESFINQAFGKRPDAAVDLVEVIAFFQADRYEAFNLMNLPKLGTIEVRLKHGSSDPIENHMWIKLLGVFALHAINVQDKLLHEGSVTQTLIWEINQTKSWGNLGVLNNAMHTIVSQSKLRAADKSELLSYWSGVQKRNMSSFMLTGGAAMNVDTQVPIMLFSYGSNSTKQLAERLGRPRETFTRIPGYLQDYVRIFAGYSRRWGGGVASVHALPGKRVYGTLTALNETELGMLDRYETGYTRHRMTVYTGNNGTSQAVVYVKNNPMFTTMPSEAYMRAIRTMLDETQRRHKNKILIHGVMKDNSIKKMGTWSHKK